MNELQVKLIELLGDFHAFCQEQGLAYILGEGAALAAVREESLAEEYNKILVLMPWDDYRRLESFAESELPEGRFIESPAINPSFPHVCLHFGNALTTQVIMRSTVGTRHHGIHLTIAPMVPCKGKLTGMGQKKQQMANARRQDVAGEVCYVNEDAKASFSEEERARIYAASILPEEEATHVYVQVRRSKPLIIAKDVVAARKMISWQGLDLWIAEDHAAFLAKVYGKRWKKVVRKHKPLGSGVFCDLETPFSAYADVIEGMASGFAAYERKADALEAAKEACEVAREALDQDKRYYFRTLYRFKDGEQCLPVKEQIVKAYEAQDFAALKTLLKAAKSHAAALVGYDLPYAFDREIYRILIDVFEREKKPEVAEYLRKTEGEAFRYLEEVSTSSAGDRAKAAAGKEA